MTRRFAVGHAGEGDQKTVLRPWPLPRAVYPAGGLASDVHDLLRYARFHMGDGRAPDGDIRLLTEESLAKMQGPQAKVYGKQAWGLAWV